MAIPAAYWYGGIWLRDGIASALESELPMAIGPAKYYNAIVAGKTADLLRGRASSVVIVGEQVELSSGLCVDRFEATLEGVRYDLRTRAVTGLDAARFKASADENHLNQYIRSRFSDIPGCRLRLRQDGVTLTARPEALGMELDIKADGKLRVEENHRVVFDIHSVRTLGLRIPTPSVARDYIGRKLNPILDTGGWGFGLKLESVETTPEFVTLIGSAGKEKSE